jgi:tRNA(fMet)-specific endonuclease VapC
MRSHDKGVLANLQAHVLNRDSIVISAVTYAELRFGAIGKKASPKLPMIVDEFVDRLDAVLPWDKKAVEAASCVKKSLSEEGQVIGHNDTLIAGHAISQGCVLVTNNTREFKRVSGLIYEDWVSDK